MLFSLAVIAQDNNTDGPYAVLVNGATEYLFTLSENKADDGREQLNVSVPLQANDYFVLLNKATGDTWVPRLEAPSDQDPNKALHLFTVADGKVSVSEAGCYNFWWKKAFNNDDLYIGSNGDCSGQGGDDQGNQGGQGGQGGDDDQGNQGGQGGGEVTTGDFYLVGYWDGKNVGETDYDKFYEEYRLAGCKWSGTLASSEGPYAYVRAKLMLNGGSGWMFYSTVGFQGNDNTEMTFYSADYMYRQGTAGQSEKWAVPANQQLYIVLTVVSADEIKMKLVSQAEYEAHDCGSYVPGQGGGEPGQGSGENLTVQFQKPEDWTTVNIYAWGGSNFGDWPGSAMTDEGNGWYSAEIVSGSNIIFNDGTKQTVDIENVTESTCYTVGEADGAGKYAVNISTDCVQTAVEETELINFRVENGMIIGEGEMQIYNIMGQNVTAENGKLNGMYIVRIGKQATKVLVK